MYPLVILKDRYTGAYSNGKYTAWNCFHYNIPSEVEGDDITCSIFWDEFKQGKIHIDNIFTPKLYCGFGETPNKALKNLEKIKKDR